MNAIRATSGTPPTESSGSGITFRRTTIDNRQVLACREVGRDVGDRFGPAGPARSPG
jgi:hypothetical protein